MISFERKDNQIFTKVKLAIPGTTEWTYTCSFQENDVPTAQLVINAFEDALQEKLRQIRKKSYEQGWSDAKAKRKKCEWFGCWWG